MENLNVIFLVKNGGLSLQAYPFNLMVDIDCFL